MIYSELYSRGYYLIWLRVNVSHYYLPTLFSSLQEVSLTLRNCALRARGYGIWARIERSQRRTGRILAPQEDKHVKKSETASPLMDTREDFTSINEIHVQADDTGGVTVTGDIFT